MENLAKQTLLKSIKQADKIVKVSDEASTFKQECADLKCKTLILIDHLRRAVRACSEPYRRPAEVILADTEQVLVKVHSLIMKCRSSGWIVRFFMIVPAVEFRKVSDKLEDSIGNVSWLVRVYAADRNHLGIPPITVGEPMLGLIWETIVHLYAGSAFEKAQAAGTMEWIARECGPLYGKLSVEEGCIGPLLRLLREDDPEVQGRAASVFGFLSRDSKSAEQIAEAGVCSIFAELLEKGPINVQTQMAWSVAELAGNYHKCQDNFAETNIISVLVSLLASNTVLDRSNCAFVRKVNFKINNVNYGVGVKDEDSELNKTQLVKGKLKSNHYSYQNSYSDAESQLVLKARMKKMAALALCHLAKDNRSVCHSIIKYGGLLCLVVLLEKGTVVDVHKYEAEVMENCAMAIVAITAVAEKDEEMRRSAFKPTSPACKVLVDRLMDIVEKGYGEIQAQCINAIGNLARTFRASETRIIPALVKSLENKSAHVSIAASNALTKFTCTENYLHSHHSEAILSAGGAKHLVQLVSSGKEHVKIPALILLSCISCHVPKDEELAQNEVLILLDWALEQPFTAPNQALETLLLEAISRLELYQSRVPHSSIK